MPISMQEAVKNGTGRIVPPAQHAVAINRYMTSATGRKESVRSGILRPVLAKEMGLFMQQAQPQIDARMRAAMYAASSEERRVGNECVSTCRSRWWPCHYKQKPLEQTNIECRQCNANSTFGQYTKNKTQ